MAAGLRRQEGEGRADRARDQRHPHRDVGRPEGDRVLEGCMRLRRARGHAAQPRLEARGQRRSRCVLGVALVAARAGRALHARPRGARGRTARRGSRGARRTVARARPAGAHHRIRAALRDLQARAAPVHRRRPPGGHRGRCAPARPVHLRGQGASARSRRAGLCAQGLRDDASSEAARQDHADRGVRHGGRSRARLGLRRVAQQSDPPARGERHERHEVAAARRHQLLDPRRLVARGLRRHERLGDRQGRRRRIRRGRRARRWREARPP